MYHISIYLYLGYVAVSTADCNVEKKNFLSVYVHRRDIDYHDYDDNGDDDNELLNRECWDILLR